MQTLIQKNANCICTNIDNKLIILQIDTGKYFELNTTGKIIWDLLDKYNKPHELIEFLEDAYPDAKNLEKSVGGFLENCKLLGFISMG